jgi:hypothetical protein
VLDSYNNPVPGVAITFAAPSGGPSSSLSGGGIATTNAQGIATLPLIANTVAGSYTVTAGAPGLLGTASYALTNTSAVASSFFVSGFPTPSTAGVAHSFTVTARDAYGNVATGYTGTVHFTSSDGQAVLPADSSLTNGTGSFVATLKTAGTQSITATDTVTPFLSGGQSGLTVSPAAASLLVVNGPSKVAPSATFTVDVTAEDPYGNVATGYTGTILFSSTDSKATLPGNSILIGGKGTFRVMFKTKGSQTLTVSDVASPSITGSLAVNVDPPGSQPSAKAQAQHRISKTNSRARGLGPDEHQRIPVRRSSMKIRTMILPALVALSWMALGTGARADITLNTPAGLHPGDQFRFVFVTDGTTHATSQTISDYDNFVQTQAGGAAYNGATVSWQDIGTTDTVNAIDHISQTNTPVYLADGSLVTTSTTTSGLWSGSLLHAIDEDLNKSIVSTIVWTGTGKGGTSQSSFSSTFDVTLGSSTTQTLVGQSSASDSTWTDGRIADSQTFFSWSLYGISQVLTVPGATTVVPEPSTAIVAAFGAVAFLAYGWSRHRREQRRQAAA